MKSFFTKIDFFESGKTKTTPKVPLKARLSQDGLGVSQRPESISDSGGGSGLSAPLASIKPGPGSTSSAHSSANQKPQNSQSHHLPALTPSTQNDVTSESGKSNTPYHHKKKARCSRCKKTGHRSKDCKAHDSSGKQSKTAQKQKAAFKACEGKSAEQAVGILNAAGLSSAKTADPLDVAPGNIPLEGEPDVSQVSSKPNPVVVTAPCFLYWKFGKCPRGDKCPYAHAITAKNGCNEKSKEICWNYKNTKSCKFGHKCKFLHSDDPTPSPKGKLSKKENEGSPISSSSDDTDTSSDSATSDDSDSNSSSSESSDSDSDDDDDSDDDSSPGDTSDTDDTSDSSDDSGSPTAPDPPALSGFLGLPIRIFKNVKLQLFGPPVKQKKVKKSQLKKIALLHANVEDKIRGRLLNADLNCRKQFRTTCLSAINIVRKEEAYKLGVNVADIVQSIYNRVQRELLSRRYYTALEAANTGSVGLNLNFCDYLQWVRIGYRPLFERVEYLESRPIGSGTPSQLAPWFGLATATLESTAVTGLGYFLHARYAPFCLPALQCAATCGKMLFHCIKGTPFTVSRNVPWSQAREMQNIEYVSNPTKYYGPNEVPLKMIEDVPNPAVFDNPSDGKWLTSTHLALSLMVSGIAFSVFESFVRNRRLSAYRLAVHASTALAPQAPTPYLGLARHILAHFTSNCIAGFQGKRERMADITTDVCLADRVYKHTPTQNQYKCTERQAICTPKFALRHFWGIQDYAPTVFRNCHHNEKVAMEGRVGKELPIHKDPKALAACRAEWSMLTKTVMPAFKSMRRVTSGLPFDEWVQPFPAAKRAMFTELKENVNEEYDDRASSFIKREKAIRYGFYDGEVFIPLTYFLWKDPRFIQGCNPAKSLISGPHIRKYAKVLRDHLEPKGTEYQPAEIRKGKQVIYTCGRTAEQVGHYLAKAIVTLEEMKKDGDEVVFFEDDQSRFDLHMIEGSFYFLDSIYKSKLTKKVRKTMRRTKCSRGKSSLGTRYSIPYTMQSGETDTSAGDTTVNTGMKIYIHGGGRPWIAIINGDDSITITLASELRRLGGKAGIDKEYAKLGMEVTSEISNLVSDVEFCSGTFRPTNGSYILFPKVGNLFSKILYDDKDRHPKFQMGWLRGIASTLAHFGLVDPLCAALSEGIMAITGEGAMTREALNPYKSWPDGTNRPSVQDINTFYATRYGLNAQDIEEACDTLRNIKLYDSCECPLIKHLAEIDQSPREISYSL